MPLRSSHVSSTYATQKLFRQLALGHRIDALWTLITIGFVPDSEDMAVATNALQSMSVPPEHPVRYLDHVMNNLRTLKNSCVVTIRNSMSQNRNNILFRAEKLNIPIYMKKQITAELSTVQSFSDVFCNPKIIF